MDKRKRYNVLLSKDEHAKIRAQAIKEGKSFAGYMREQGLKGSK